MRVKYLKLKNFKRFPLSDLELFEQEFNSKLTMITGPNGAGKSSLFNELTPLPADKNNFNKDGYKEIHFTKDHREFVLISDFTDGTHFSFMVDGVEENHSNNVSTQRELAYRYFKITPTIHELLIGSESFTDMSLIARKKLFSAITHMNIDRVIEHYNRLKEDLKIKETILKTQTSLLQSEELKLTNEHRLEQLKDTQHRTREFIEYLLSVRTELHRYRSSSSIEEPAAALKEVNEKLKALKIKYYPLLVSYPKGDLERYKITHTSAVQMLSYQLSEIYTQIDRKQQELRTLSDNKDTNLLNVEATWTARSQQVQQFIQGLRTFTDLNADTEALKSAIYKLELSIPEILRGLPCNPRDDGKRKISRDRYDQLLVQKESYLKQLNQLIQDESFCDKELNELKQHDDNVTCPNCQHTWSQKDIPRLTREIHLKLQTVLRQKVTVQQDLKQLEEELQSVVEYFTLYRQYTALRSATYDTLKPFWNTVDEKEWVFENPIAILSLLSVISLDIHAIEEIRKLKKLIQQDEETINLLKQVKDTNYETVLNQLRELEQKATELQTNKDDNAYHLNMVQKATTLYDHIHKLETLVNTHKTQLRQANLSKTTNDLISEIDSELSKQKVTLIEVEKELHQHSTIQYTIERYKKTIDDVSVDVKVLNILLEELSPKTGLIAKAVSSFLNIIIGNINTTIASIWNYKMVLKAIDVESDSLNYKFKVEVEDKLPIEDINKISRGMKEIVNLSFKLVLYKLLKFDQYPMWLDELAANLDKDHTSRMTQLVHTLATSDVYSQVFLISHKENFSFLKGVEIIEL